MKKQTKRPLGIYLEDTRGMGAGNRQRRWPWILFALLLISAGAFCYKKLPHWKKSLGEIQFIKARSRTPLHTQVLDAQPLTLATHPAANGKTTLQPSALPPLPEYVLLREAVSLTVKREGLAIGVLYLQPGQRVVPIVVNGDKMEIAWGDAVGSIPVTATDFARDDVAGAASNRNTR
jgi:hypothetical protein